VLEQNISKANCLKSKMQALAHLPIEHIRHQGMIAAFDVRTDDPAFSRQCYAEALKQGLLLRPIGNTVYFMPPYTISEAEMDWMVQATKNTLEEIL
jgi:adenosylmethionine-8-amino-7-oxononanoate aminotransferase